VSSGTKVAIGRIETHGGELTGRARISRSESMKRVLGVLAVLTLVLVGLIAWRIRAQGEAESGPASGSGVVEAEGIDLASRLSARVRTVHVQEGQEIEAGAPILSLECDEHQVRLAEATARLEAARAQVLGAKSQALAARGQSSAALASIQAVGAQIGALSAQQELAARDSERMEAMGQYAALSSRDRAKVAASELLERQKAAQASELVSRRQAGAASAQAQAALAQVTAAERAVAALEATVKSAELLVEECTVRAPRAGVLERVYFEPGELVMTGALVARLVDPQVANVTFYLANTDVDAARVGMRAQVRADAYPGQDFLAEVTRIGLEAEFTPRNVQTRSDRDRLVYPVEVRVREHKGKLRTGMQAVVSLAGAP
jgi:HlyD family secretion protein